MLLGSDYPYDMGMYDGVKRVRALKIADVDRRAVLGGSAIRLLGGLSPQA